MTNLRFDFEWQDAAAARGEELRATWASLAISINDCPVTELQDRRTKSVRTSIFLPLYPLAEWFAQNWWFLQAEPEPASGAYAGRFDRRHNLRWAREGFVLPSLRFVTLGDAVDIFWQPLDVPHAGIGFLSGGRTVLPGPDVYRVMHDFVEAVVARLDDCGVSGTSLHEEWSAIQNADADERAFCQAAARLGVDPYAVNSDLEAEILDVAARIRSELFGDFLSVANVEKLTEQAAKLVTATDLIASDADDIDPLKMVRNQAPPCRAHGNPWENGYRYATTLRGGLNGRAWKSHSLAELAGYLNIDQLDRCILPETVECAFLDALTGTNQCKRPKFLIGKKRPDSRQFAFCRAMFEHLTSPPGRFATVSKLRTTRQQMNRAFAAEFLAPREMLRGDLSGATIGEDELDDLAADYGVSAFVIRHQVENHNLARILL